MLASTLTLPCCFVPGTILALDEVDRRLAAQRAAVKALGLGVPQAVVIRDAYAEGFQPAERRWFGHE